MLRHALRSYPRHNHWVSATRNRELEKTEKMKWMAQNGDGEMAKIGRDCAKRGGSLGGMFSRLSARKLEK